MRDCWGFAFAATWPTAGEPAISARSGSSTPSQQSAGVYRTQIAWCFPCPFDTGRLILGVTHAREPELSVGWDTERLRLF